MLHTLVAQTVKNLPAMQETWVQSPGWEELLVKGMPPTPVFLPGESHGQKSLVSYSPWGCKESDMTERQPPPPQQMPYKILFFSPWNSSFIGPILQMQKLMLRKVNCPRSHSERTVPLSVCSQLHVSPVPLCPARQETTCPRLPWWGFLVTLASWRYWRY